MDTPAQPDDAPARCDLPLKYAEPRESRSRGRSFPRLSAGEVDLARRLSALLGAPTSRAGDPWPLVRALVALMSPDVVRDLRLEPEVITRDQHLALLTIDIRREVDGCDLLVRVSCEVHATEPGEDTQDVTAVEMTAWGTTVQLDAAVTLTSGELDYVDSRVEAARAWICERIHDDAIDASEVR